MHKLANKNFLKGSDNSCEMNQLSLMIQVSLQKILRKSALFDEKGSKFIQKINPFFMYFYGFM